MEKELRAARGAELLKDDKIVIEFLRGVNPFVIATALNVTRQHVLNVLKQNEETAEILEKEDDTNDDETAIETLLHDDSETEKQKEVE